VTLSPGHSFTLRKEKWNAVDRKLIDSRDTTVRFVIAAIDRREAGIGSLSGSHLSVLGTIESGLAGKMSAEQSSRPFVSRVTAFLNQVAREGDTVVVAGPGHTKSAVVNELGEQKKGTLKVRLLEGLDLTGADGVRALVKLPAFQELAKGTVLVEVQNLVAEAIKRISSGDPKVAYTLPRVKGAAAAGAVAACAVSDDVFSASVDEEELVTTLNEIEALRGRVYLTDSSLEFGKQVSSFGGIVALLRYGLRAY